MPGAEDARGGLDEGSGCGAVVLVSTIGGIVAVLSATCSFSCLGELDALSTPCERLEGGVAGGGSLNI